MTVILIICVLGFIVLGLNIKMVQKNLRGYIRVICTVLFMLSMMRYMTLILFAGGRSIELLSKMQWFYFVTLLGIPILSILVLWYITPFYRKKIGIKTLHMLCMPWVILYIRLCTSKPFEIINSSTRGYELRLIRNWNIYLSVFQWVFSIIFISGAVYGYTLYKHKQIRSQYLVLIICQLLFLVDSLSYYGFNPGLIPSFTLTEVFGFLGIYYGFARSPIDARGIQR